MAVNYYNTDKLERARVRVGVGASEEAVLKAYIELCGKYEGELELETETKPKVAKPVPRPKKSAK